MVTVLRLQVRTSILIHMLCSWLNLFALTLCTAVLVSFSNLSVVLPNMQVFLAICSVCLPHVSDSSPVVGFLSSYHVFFYDPNSCVLDNWNFLGNMLFCFSLANSCLSPCLVSCIMYATQFASRSMLLWQLTSRAQT